jgi:prepilin-type N-terminal cleavage/methylation domain-containing protein
MTKAFTMMELIIVVVILGVVATLAIPRMTGTTEQVIASEAFSLLETLHAAERRYELEKSAYTDDCDLLDIDVVPKNFQAPACEADGDVSLTKIGGAYTVTKNINGTFSCAGCPAGVKLPN